jgi:nitrite reductase/ring-hydroxylating ferredoxin subunit
VIVVGNIDDLREKVPVIIDIGGREVVIVRWENEVFALRNTCPHQSQSFFSGTVHERIVSTGKLGGVAISDDQPILACPWHSWGFDLRSGQCSVDKKLRVAIFTTEVKDGQVLVDAPWVKSEVQP